MRIGQIKSLTSFEKVLDLETRDLGMLRFTVRSHAQGTRVLVSFTISGVNGEDGGPGLGEELVRNMVVSGFTTLEGVGQHSGKTYNVAITASWIGEAAIIADHIQDITYIQRNAAVKAKMDNLSHYYQGFVPAARAILATARKLSLLSHIAAVSGFCGKHVEMGPEEMREAWDRHVIWEVMET